MAGIKAKIGRCIDCPPDAPEKPLTKKRCQFHYWKNNAKENAEKKKSKGKEKVKTAKEMNLFFASELPNIPERCENCNASLKWQKMNNYKSIIAHILPKRKVGGFPSVATHPKNRVFLCLECHGNFDNKGAEYATKMNCFDVICERFMEFESLLSEADKQRLPFYFKDLLKIKY